MITRTVTKENIRFIQGAMIINAPSASLNLGEDGIKRISKIGENGNLVRFSYLSGQFIKSKIKEGLISRENVLSKPEIVQEKNKKNTPTSSCNPFVYLDDDLFGYMNVIESENHINPGTTRVAPFKISYFLGKEGDISKDYAVKQNGALLEDGNLTTRPLDDNNRFFASTSYFGCFSIDVNYSGRFFRGSTSGFKNISNNFPTKEYEAMLDKNSDEKEFILKNEIRQKRIQELINSLPSISGGARQATVYSDLAPKFIVLCATDCGNHLFQEIASIYEHFNIKALIEGVTDFKDNIKSNIYIALKSGFLENKRSLIIEELKKYNSDNYNYKFIFNEDLSRINEITNRFSSEVIPKIFDIKGV